MKKRLKIMKKPASVLVFICLAQLIPAQQLPLYSQYLYNKFLINPAHAGSDGYTSFNLTVREQWVGYSGAPRTFSLSWQTRFLKKEYQVKQNLFKRTIYRPKTDGKVGLGAYIFSDRNGLIQRTGFQGTYAYHMWVDDKTQLSLGMALTGYQFIINADETSFENQREPWLTDNLRRGVFIPDADFGIYMVNRRFDIGFSVQQLFGAAAKIGDYAYRSFRMDRHYYLFGSYTYQVDKNEYEPSLLLKVSDQIKPQADIGLTYIYDQSLWTGLAYRTGGAIIANVRFKYVPKKTFSSAVFIGYAFDYSMNQIQSVTYGTHELTIALKTGDSRRKFRWLDRY
jgi:type IX secretion system PorP/SprF family membrane protein